MEFGSPQQSGHALVVPTTVGAVTQHRLLETVSGIEPSNTTLIIDNGAYISKFGLANQDRPRMLPNYVGKSKTGKRRLVGDELLETKDILSMHQTRPVERGYIINWELQKEIWNVDGYFKAKVRRPFVASDTDLILTEAPMIPNSLRRVTDEQIFEEYGFRSLFAPSSAFLAMIGHRVSRPHSEFAQSPCHVIVDCGYSSTTISLFLDEVRLNYATLRINAGGKLLTNYLKEMISYRQYDVSDETSLINMIKEKLCFVSNDFSNDLNKTKQRGKANTIKREYVLPDNVTTTEGYILQEEEAAAKRRENPDLQTLVMNNERICVPEVLFHPSDIGLSQCGIAEAIAVAIGRTPAELHAAFFSNILVYGGSCLFEGFFERLQTELRSFAPVDVEPQVHRADNPLEVAWWGGVAFSRRANCGDYCVSKSQWEEFGDSLCRRKFSLV